MTRYEVEQRIHERVQNALNADDELWRLWAEYFAEQGGSCCTLSVSVSMPGLGRCSQAPASDEEFLRGLQIMPQLGEVSAREARRPWIFGQLDADRRKANQDIAAMRRRWWWWLAAMGCLWSALVVMLRWWK